MPAHCFSEEFQCRFAITALGHEAFEHLTLVIHRPPQVVSIAADLPKDLVETPFPKAGSHTLDAALPDLRCKHPAKPKPPVADHFVAGIDAALMQEILNIRSDNGNRT